MKTFIQLAMMATMLLPAPALAQWDDDDDDWTDEPNYPAIETGFFRMVNNGYGDVLSLSGAHALSLSATENDARTMPGTIFYYDTNGIYSFYDDMSQLGDDISVAELMRLMATSAWKSGDFTTYDLTTQGVSLVGYLHRLKDFVDRAIQNFPESEEVKDFYENGPAWYLSVAMSGAFYPADMASLDTFKAAVARWLKQWKNYFDINLYLKPAQNVENGFLLHFHTPMDISKVQDTQDQINNMTSEESGSMGYHYDFFGCFKRKVAKEAAKELDAEGTAYVEHVLDQLLLDRECYIGENEQGELYVVGLTKEAQFGENGELLQVNQDELVWTMQPVDEVNPLMVEMYDSKADGYWSTLFTEFPYQLGEGLEAYYVVADGAQGAKLAPIEGGKVPAMTAVVLHSQHRAAVSNVLLPVDEELPAIEGNLLKGTCLPLQLSEPHYVMGIVAGGESTPVGLVASTTAVAANSCYLDRQLVFAEGVSGIETMYNEQCTMNNKGYDLLGRRSLNSKSEILNSKGVKIINGKKIVK